MSSMHFKYPLIHVVIQFRRLQALPFSTSPLGNRNSPSPCFSPVDSAAKRARYRRETQRNMDIDRDMATFVGEKNPNGHIHAEE